MRTAALLTAALALGACSLGPAPTPRFARWEFVQLPLTAPESPEYGQVVVVRCDSTGCRYLVSKPDGTTRWFVDAQLLPVRLENKGPGR